MTLDDTLDAHPEGRLWWTTLLVTALPLAGIFWTPLTGDVVLIALSVLGLVSGSALVRRKKKLGSLPLVIASSVVRDPWDHQWRARVWLGRGRPMHALEVTFEYDGGTHTVRADTPVVGPWTALAQLPQPPTRVHARCSSAEQSWVASAAPKHALGRFRHPLEVRGSSARWLRQNWELVEQTEVDMTV